MKKYLDIHKRIKSYENLIKSGDMEISEVETKLPKPVFQIYEEVNKILKDNNILKNEEDIKLSQL